MKSEEFMPIVKEICSITPTDCRSLNKAHLARQLMDLLNIPQNAEIYEIPLDWDDEVVILFMLPNDKNYYSLGAGHWLDGTERLILSITGRWKGREFKFFQEEGKEDIPLPLDYFQKKKQKGKGEKEMRDKILKVSYIMAWIGAIWFMLSLEASMWNIIPSLLCIAYVYAFGEANNGNWIIAPH